MEKMVEYLKTELFNHNEQMTQCTLEFLKQCEAIRKFERDMKEEQEKLDSEFEDLHFQLRLISSAPPSPHHHPLVNGEDEKENDDGRRSAPPPYFRLYPITFEEEEKKIEDEEKRIGDEEKKTGEEQINIRE